MRPSTTFTSRRLTAGVAAILMTVGLGACSSDSGGGKGGGSKRGPDEVVQIDHLTGRTTAVALDKGFVGALKKLKLTPGVVGGAKLTSGGSLAFPITGGNVTYYKPGSVSP